MAYHLNPDRRCHVCWRFGLDPEHLKACVPRRYWPQETETAAGEASVMVFTPEAPSTAGGGGGTLNATVEVVHGRMCDCGYVAKNAQALRMHRLKAKQHQPVPLPNGEFLPEAS